MRIGIDAHAAEREGTGNCTYIRGLLGGLAKIDHRNEYFLYATEKYHHFYSRFKDVANFHIKYLRPKNPLLRIPLALGRRTFSDNLDVLHAQYIAPPLHKGKLVLTIHDVAFLHFPQSFGWFERCRSKLLVPQNAQRAARILCGSRYSKLDIAKRCGVSETKIEITHYGTSLSSRPVETHNERKQEVLKKYGIDKKFIFTLSRLNLRKNLKTLIEVYVDLRDREKIDMLLVIGGRKDVFSEEITRYISKAGCRGDIILTGFIEEKDLPFLYNSAEVFVYPSLFEGFGLPPLEAMACGCPVVTSKHSSLPEVVGEAGVLVNPSDSEELLKAIVSVLSDAALRDGLRTKGLERAQQFSWEATARKTLAVYEDVRRHGEKE